MRLDKVLYESRRTAFFKWLNLFLALTALIYCVRAGYQAQRYTGQGVLVISPVINDNQYYFSSDDIEQILEGDYRGLLASEHVTDAQISAGEIKAYAAVMQTGYDYFYINPMVFIDGGPWTEDRDDAVIVSESLAWMLFGNVKNTGDEVVINGKTRIITGIIKQGTVSKDNCYAWIPLSPLEEANYASRLYLKPANYNKLGSYLSACDILSNINRSERNYHITDLNRYVENIGLRAHILFFCVGLYVILLIILYAYRLVKNAIANKTAYVTTVVLCVICVPVVAVVVYCISFDVWLPAFAGSYFKMITNTGLLPAQAYLPSNLAALSRLNTYANIAFGAGLLGFLQFVFLHRA